MSPRGTLSASDDGRKKKVLAKGGEKKGGQFRLTTEEEKTLFVNAEKKGRSVSFFRRLWEEGGKT